jgi:hypothetical protein
VGRLDDYPGRRLSAVPPGSVPVWRAELRCVEEVLDARLKQLEERG